MEINGSNAIVGVINLSKSYHLYSTLLFIFFVACSPLFVFWYLTAGEWKIRCKLRLFQNSLASSLFVVVVLSFSFGCRWGNNHFAFSVVIAFIKCFKISKWQFIVCLFRVGVVFTRCLRSSANFILSFAECVPVLCAYPASRILVRTQKLSVWICYCFHLH